MEILNYQDEIGGNTLGIFDVYIPAIGLTLHRFKVIARKKGGWFVSIPSYCVDKSGEKKFFQYMTFSKERESDFMKAVTELLKPYVTERKSDPF